MEYMGKHANEAYGDVEGNVAIGGGALKGSAGADRPQAISNVAIGNAAMFSSKSDNDDGTDSTNLSVKYNVCVGASAGFYIKGESNTCLGYYSGLGDGSPTANQGNIGDHNVAVGAGSLKNMEDANYNISIGSESGTLITDGSNNVIVGYDAGDTITTGGSNICIGKGSDVSASGASGQVAIGTDVACTGDNTTVIGNTTITLDAGGDIALTAGTDAGTTGTVIIDRNVTSTSDHTSYGLSIDFDKSGNATGTNSMYGLNIDMDNTTSEAGTQNMYGIRVTPTCTLAADAGLAQIYGAIITATGSSNGVSLAYGISNTVTGADTCTGFVSTVDDGGVDIRLQSSADTGDKFEISTTTHGATTIETTDDNAANANLDVVVDGNICIDANGRVDIDAEDGDINFLDAGVNLATIQSGLFAFHNNANATVYVTNTAAGTAGKSLTIAAGTAGTAGANNTDGGDLILKSGGGDGTGTSAMTFFTKINGTDAAAERMRIHTDGKVGIGVNDPDALLEIFGTTTHFKLSYDASNYVNMVTTSGGDFRLTTVGSGTTDSDIFLDADGGILLDAASGNFLASVAGTEFSVANSSYAGMILGYTTVGIDATADSKPVTASFVVTDSAHKVKFVAPPSGVVEIFVSIMADLSRRNLYFGLSDAATYAAIHFPNTDDPTNEHLVAIPSSTPGTEDYQINHTWVVTGLTPGTAYEWWLGASASAGGNVLRWGGDATEEYAPFIMKATALPKAVADFAVYG
jgi:hypothetical protein